MDFPTTVAFRYLWSKRSEAFITIISVLSVVGVAIGVTVLTIVMAVMTGFQHELREKILSTNSHIVVRRLGGPIAEWRRLEEELAALPEVASVSPFTYHQVLLTSGRGATGILLRGVARGSAAAAQLSGFMGPDGLEPLFNPPKVFVEEESADPVTLPGMVVGAELQRSLGLYVGEPISVLSPQMGSSPFGLAPKARRFVVSGIYRSGLVEYEEGLAYVALEEAQRFFRMGDTISGFEIRVRNVDRSPIVSRQITALLGGAQGGFFVQDWTETNRPLWEAIQLEKRVYFIVLLLIIIMASVSIVSTLIMIVLEKRRDIAVLMTLGATGREIARIFVTQGAVIGALGTVFGVALGLAGCFLLREYGFPLDERIFQMSTLPLKIEPLNVASVAIAAFAISTLATLYPAYRASQLQPSDVLRHD